MVQTIGGVCSSRTGHICLSVSHSVVLDIRLSLWIIGMPVVGVVTQTELCLEGVPAVCRKQPPSSESSTAPASSKRESST